MSPAAEFWHARWREGITPWHQGRANRFLARHFHTLGLDEGSRVLVPLCGKAVDMRVLLEWRYRVLGVELSDIAARDFFEENGLRYQRRKEGAFEVFDGDDATILCGDVFDLGAQQLAQVDAVYDRAALIALDEPARDRYVRQLSALLPDGVPQLVVTLEYDEQRMDGPPFSVSPSEVQARYSHRYGVRSLGRSDVLDDEPRFRDRGLDALTEHAFLLIDAKA